MKLTKPAPATCELCSYPGVMHTFGARRAELERDDSMSSTPSTEAAQNEFALHVGFVVLGVLLMPGTLMIVREAYLNAYGQYSLNIHTAPALVLASALSFLCMCAWEAVGIVLVGVAVARRRPVHMRDVLALIVGAAVVSIPFFV